MEGFLVRGKALAQPTGRCGSGIVIDEFRPASFIGNYPEIASHRTIVDELSERVSRSEDPRLSLMQCEMRHEALVVDGRRNRPLDMPDSLGSLSRGPVRHAWRVARESIVVDQRCYDVEVRQQATYLPADLFPTTHAATSFAAARRTFGGEYGD